MVFEDRLWHMALPLLAYASLGVSALALARETNISLFVIAGTTLLLLFVGIHNAWDTVTHMVVQGREAETPGGSGKHRAPRSRNRPGVTRINRRCNALEFETKVLRASRVRSRASRRRR
jgi:hypothetical protein